VSWLIKPHRATVVRSAHVPDVAAQITLRLAIVSDAVLLSKFSCADSGQRYTRDVEDLIRSDVAEEVAADSDELRVVVALDGAEIVAVIAHSVVDIDGLGEVEYIHALGVRADYRRRLIGTLLKQNVLDYAYYTGIGQVVSEVHRRNHAMLALNRELNADTDTDPDDGNYLLTVTASTPVAAEFTDDPGHYGDDGPVAAATRLLDAVGAGSFGKVWALLDSNLRQCRAQAWLWNNRIALERESSGTPDAMLRELMNGPAPTVLWREFAAVELAQLTDVWGEWLRLAAAGSLGAASRTRMVGPGYEHVLLADTSDGPISVQQPTSMHVLALTLHHDAEGWTIAAYSTELPEPGWPPNFGNQ
jgi:GNAT superfamily N-acetyltransferase